MNGTRSLVAILDKWKKGFFKAARIVTDYFNRDPNRELSTADIVTPKSSTQQSKSPQISNLLTKFLIKHWQCRHRHFCKEQVKNWPHYKLVNCWDDIGKSLAIQVWPTVGEKKGDPLSIFLRMRSYAVFPVCSYTIIVSATYPTQSLSLIHIWRCRRTPRCRSRWSPYH